MKRLTYKKAGVDIFKAEGLIKDIKAMAEVTKKGGVISDIGSFGGLYALDIKKFSARGGSAFGGKDPVLVSSTDGVGTKLMIAQLCDKHDTVGIDLVAMCANDVATTGAQPLFFLDYVATGKLNAGVFKDIIKGIAQACEETGYALIGGETAEMPDMYAEGSYDLAGFCVGIINRGDIIDGMGTKKGDIVLGIASNGLHSNGFSLVRKVFTKKEQIELKDELLKPTRLYVRPLLGLAKEVRIKGAAHITGGAFSLKVPRIVPKDLAIIINKRSWPVPEIFNLIQKKANIADQEMYRVFNMGIGMAVVLNPRDIKKAQGFLLNKCGMNSWVIGDVVRGNKEVRVI